MPGPGIPRVAGSSLGPGRRGILSAAVLAAEIAVYPFQEGADPPPHVQAAIEEMRKAGLEVELAPLGLVLSGDAGQLLDALRAGVLAAMAAGATKVVASFEVSEVAG